MIVDTFQGCFKDGTEPGTRDCRWFSAMFLGIRVFVFVIFSAVPTATCFVFFTVGLVLFVLLLVVIQPYKHNFSHYLHTNTIFLLFAILVVATMVGVNMAAIKASPAFCHCLHRTGSRLCGDNALLHRRARCEVGVHEEEVWQGGLEQGVGTVSVLPAVVVVVVEDVGVEGSCLN